MGAFTSDLIRSHAPDCWFPLNHAEAMRQHPRLRLRALCDVDNEALARAAWAHGVAATYTDLRRLLQEVRPCLLGIATRTIGRADAIQDAVAQGVQALHVEKPLCNSMRELAALESTFERSGVFVTYGTLRRHLAPFQAARALAESGRYGPLREIRVNLGSGTLFWTHPHSVDLLLYGAGNRPVAGAQARLAEVSTPASRWDVLSDPRVLSAAIHFKDGVVGHITQALGSDFVLSCAEAEITVRADGGAIEIYAAPPGAIYPRTAPLADVAATPAGPTGSLAPISQLVACLDHDSAAIAANAVVKRDLLLGQRILFAMLQSHLMGSRIVEPAAVDEAIFVRAQSGGRHA
jgi:scyllo-inositol 2-dehydrogenase (NAD+)